MKRGWRFMSQNDRMTTEELEFLAKRNKAINFKEELTPEKEEMAFEAYKKAFPVFKSSLICVNGFADGVDAKLVDYHLAMFDESDFNGENQDTSILFSFSAGISEANCFVIVTQYELDKLVKGEYVETLHQLEIVLKRYYSAISKDFSKPLDLKALRVEALNEAVQENPTLIDGDYEVKHIEVNKNGLTMRLTLLADISLTTSIYEGIAEQQDGLNIEEAVQEEKATATEFSNMENLVDSYSDEDTSYADERATLSVEGSVMKKEFVEDGQSPLYKPKFGDLKKPDQIEEGISDKLGLLGGVPMDITVVLGSTRVLLSEIKDFGVGRIIELNKSEDEPLLIYLNGELLAEGEVVIVDENYAIKITKLYQERVIKTGM